jgi:type I protein arginine methyltransferase
MSVSPVSKCNSLELIFLVWDNVYGFNYSPMKEVALTEPLVDTVEVKALVTDPCPVLTLDLNTVTHADLAFKLPFTLTCKRSDFIHAIIAWFDISFTACHKPIGFSTGPHSKYTHWKQTVFYLRDVLTVEKDETVTGYLENKPNERNKRDLDIRISYLFDAPDPARQAQGNCAYKMLVLLPLT